jgi:hypothetical protein
VFSSVFWHLLVDFLGLLACLVVTTASMFGVRGITSSGVMFEVNASINIYKVKHNGNPIREILLT